MKKSLALAAIVILSGCAATQQAQLDEAFNLSADHFRDSTTIKDSPLDKVVTLSTVDGFQQKQGALGLVWDDNYLRAFIHKDTGEVQYQVYQVLKYQAQNWRIFESVNYLTPSGLQSVPLNVLGRDVSCTSSLYAGCVYYEHVAFDIDETMLRMVAGGYAPGKRSPWVFKYKSKSGPDNTNGMLPAEVAGFMKRVDAYRDSMPKPTASN